MTIAETPLIKQYREMKKKHPDAVLLFRVGDFYETFSEDAVIASDILGITLTRRANGTAKCIELSGFPHHALDTYLPKLVRAGKRVAICEQLEDPKLTKNLVKRGMTDSGATHLAKESFRGMQYDLSSLFIRLKLSLLSNVWPCLINFVSLQCTFIRQVKLP